MGDFRSNIHQGGSAQAVRIRPEERKLAVAATRALGLDVAGVDIIRSERGPLLLEVNSSPGLEGIETATGKDLAGQMIQEVERKLGWVRSCSTPALVASWSCCRAEALGFCSIRFFSPPCDCFDAGAAGVGDVAGFNLVAIVEETLRSMVGRVLRAFEQCYVDAA